MPPVPVRPSIDRALLQPCPDVPVLVSRDDGTADPADLVLADVALAGQYLECQRLHQGLIDAVRLNEK